MQFTIRDSLTSTPLSTIPDWASPTADVGVCVLGRVRHGKLSGRGLVWLGVVSNGVVVVKVVVAVRDAALARKKKDKN